MNVSTHKLSNTRRRALENVAIHSNAKRKGLLNALKKRGLIRKTARGEWRPTYKGHVVIGADIEPEQFREPGDPEYTSCSPSEGVYPCGGCDACLAAQHSGTRF